MRKSPILLLLTIILGGSLFTGCKSRSGASGDEAIVSDFDVQEVLKSSSQSYKVTLDADTFFLNVSTSIHWPVKFGESDITPLRDSLLAYMYDAAPGTDVNAAILSFVNNRDVFDVPAQFTPVADVVIDDLDMYFSIDYNGKLMELTETYVTYQISTYSFLGGAHPNYFTRPFTYDLRDGEMLTFNHIFKPGSEEALLKLVKEYLAVQEGVKVSRLDDAGIFVNDFFLSDMVYLSNGGNGIVFHYNTYDIAPYSKGPIDVEVPAFELTPYLTAKADALINQ